MEEQVIKVFTYKTLEPIGEVQISPSGLLMSASGPPELRDWARDNLGHGLVETHSYRNGDSYDLVHAPIPPSDEEFSRRMNLRLMRKGWCMEWMADAIQRLPNYINHPWRLAHRS